MKLREITKADYPALFEFQNDPAGHWQAAFSTLRTEAEYTAHLDRILNLEDTILLAIEVDGRVVGSIGKWVSDGEPELMYWVGSEFVGRGYATEAIRLFLEHFTQRPVFAHVVADNAASIRVLEKHGFVKFEELTSFANSRDADVCEFGFRLEAQALTQP